MDDLKAALRQGFLDMDRELAQMETFRAERDASGTTAVTVLTSESKIICANLGTWSLLGLPAAPSRPVRSRAHYDTRSVPLAR